MVALPADFFLAAAGPSLNIPEALNCTRTKLNPAPSQTDPFFLPLPCLLTTYVRRCVIFPLKGATLKNIFPLSVSQHQTSSCSKSDPRRGTEATFGDRQAAVC